MANPPTVSVMFNGEPENTLPLYCRTAPDTEVSECDRGVANAEYFSCNYNYDKKDFPWVCAQESLGLYPTDKAP